MNIDQRALQDGSLEEENDNDRPMYGISCCEKNNPPLSMMMVIDRIDKGSKSSDDLGNEYDGIQSVKTTGLFNVGDDEAVKKQDDTLALRFIEKSDRDITG